MEVRAQIIHETVVWLLSVYDQIQVHKAGVVSFKYMRMHDKAIDQTTHGLLSITRRLYLNFKLNAPHHRQSPVRVQVPSPECFDVPSHILRSRLTQYPPASETEDEGLSQKDEE